MNKPTLKYIGQITYRKLKDVIIEENLTEEDTIILNSENFDDIVLEYRDFYKESMSFPHLLLGVLIRESELETIPSNRIGILKNDNESVRIKADLYNYYDGETFYRCGWCGNIVDFNGNVLEGYERERAINYIETLDKKNIKHLNGKCCPNGNN